MTRRFERTVLGAVMGMMAFIIERRVLMAIRRTGLEPSQSARRDESASSGNDPAGRPDGR